MPTFKRPDVEINYEVHGTGFPLLIFAPGGFKSQIAHWRHSPADPSKPPNWMNPMVDLADDFTVVAMDQRNAGHSRATITASDGWHSYAEDQLALMDHLGHRRFHTMGGCIGASFCLKLAELVPERIASAVLQNPIGLHENRATWDDALRNFAKAMRERDPGLSEATLASFGKNMYGGDFVFSVTREFVRGCQTPMFLQYGEDVPHPRATSDEIARLAPAGIELQEKWKGPDHMAESIKRVRAFLLRNTPRGAEKAA
ncbi:MAG: alpha/beta fold hydrolase [Proteobacteria bacterium]|nr:alpha/beta fold hydrolase [Pseudomonadota bacterium]